MERIDKTVVVPTATATATGDGGDEVDLIPVRTYWQLVRQRFLQHRLAVMALFLMLALVAVAVIVPTLTGEAYTKTSLSKAMLGPSLAAPLGTNQIGQDMFLRLAKALQTSLFIGFMAVAIIGVIGVTLGALAGYFGGWLDNLIMRFVDVILSLPVFFMILIIVAVLGKGSAIVVVIAIGLTGWTLACRLVRAEFLKLREADFVQAARALGASN
nr:ABC transporter permease [Chloroflexota bacterium]